MGAKIVKFEVINFPKTRIIGKSITVPMSIGPDDHVIEDLLGKMKNDGDFDYLFNLPNRTIKDKDFVGWMGDFNPGDEKYTYLAGVFFNPEAITPENYEYRDISNCTMAVAWLQKSDEGEGDIFVDSSEIMANAMKENGYEYDGSNGFFEMEYYSEKRFKIPEEKGENVILDFYSPCREIKK